jgi:hypothetical protein
MDPPRQRRDRPVRDPGASLSSLIPSLSCPGARVMLRSRGSKY